jgi:hypothetical protein
MPQQSTPVKPTPPTSASGSTIEGQLYADLKGAWKHHAIVLYVVIATGAFLAWRSVTGYEQALGAAQAVEASYRAQAAKDQAVIAASAAQTKAAQAQIAALEGRVARRDKTENLLLAQIAAISTAKQAAAAVGHGATALPNNAVSIPVPETKTLLADAAKVPVLTEDLSAAYQVVQLQKQALTAETNAFNASQASLAACNQTVSAWRNAAKKSLFQRILGGAEKVGIFVAGAALGHLL